MQKPEKEIRFLRDFRKRQTGITRKSSNKHTGEADSDSNSATKLLVIRASNAFFAIDFLTFK